MGIILGTGEWDNTRHECFRLSHILNSKGIQHLLDDRRWCGHDWNYWRDMLPLLSLDDLMPTFDRRFRRCRRYSGAPVDANFIFS